MQTIQTTKTAKKTKPIERTKSSCFYTVANGPLQTLNVSIYFQQMHVDGNLKQPFAFLFAHCLSLHLRFQTFDVFAEQLMAFTYCDVCFPKKCFILSAPYNAGSDNFSFQNNGIKSAHVGKQWFFFGKQWVFKAIFLTRLHI